MLKPKPFQRLLLSFALVLSLAPAAMAYPGQTLESFLIDNQGFKKTGTIFEPKYPSLRFEVWENFFFKEYSYSKYFLPCDPLDRKGYVYLPKSLLIVKVEPGRPDKKPLIVSEAQAIRVGNQEEVDVAVKAVEELVEKNYKPVTWQERVQEFIRGFTKEPLLKPVFSNGTSYVYHATYAGGRGSILLMTPDFEALPATMPKGTKVGGVVKKITYVTAYEKMALGDLANLLKPKKKEHH